DSDITGNFLAFGNDDGAELEGGGMNVRFIGNKVEGVLGGVSTGASILGPQYIIGNLIVNLADESGVGLMLFKNSHRVPQAGRRFFYNNTLSAPLASGFGPYGRTPADGPMGVMR